MSQWYYAHDGEQNGPVPISELQRLAANGKFDPEKDLVWQEGLPDWKLAKSIPELSALYPDRSSPGPATPAASNQPPAGQASPEPTPYQTPQSTASPAVPNKSYAPTGQVQSGLAVASMICGLVSFLTCFFICLSLPCALAAVVLGHISLSRVKKDPANFGGKGFATAGLITGYLGLILTILYICFAMWFGTRTPEQIDQIEWMPDDFKEQFQEAFEKQREIQREKLEEH